MDLLSNLGATSVPVVSKGDEFVYAQSLRDVAEFLDIDASVGPTLSMPELVDKLDLVLATAQRLWRQLPNEALAEKLPNRDRSYRVLGHHIFRIPEAFLEVTEGATLTYDMLTTQPPDDMTTAEDIAAYGDDVRKRVKKWWLMVEDVTGEAKVPTYFGDQPIHDVFERTAWHAAQHVRQTAMILEQRGITPDAPLSADDLDGLPVPDKVWDDEPDAAAT
jgi:DinB family protein